MEAKEGDSGNADEDFEEEEDVDEDVDEEEEEEDGNEEEEANNDESQSTEFAMDPSAMVRMFSTSTKMTACTHHGGVSSPSTKLVSAVAGWSNGDDQRVCNSPC
ncbi:unnamed protein product [Arabis nemorensis]|uniref:Uncharacterized protein n=1 Tax=Arabis nemorensis TaxID=586526 RepID=A0A565CUY9_9BRAS|nr:unnamed protein product [Arabis nemorensis]